MQILDPRSGRVEAEVEAEGEAGVTPEAITVNDRYRNRLTVFSPDLEEQRLLRVPRTSVATDQFGNGGQSRCTAPPTPWTG